MLLGLVNLFKCGIFAGPVNFSTCQFAIPRFRGRTVCPLSPSHLRSRTSPAWFSPYLFFGAIWCNLVQSGAIWCNSSPGVAVRLRYDCTCFRQNCTRISRSAGLGRRGRVRSPHNGIAAAKKRCSSQSRKPSPPVAAMQTSNPPPLKTSDKTRDKAGSSSITRIFGFATA
jgi:hypothetical protein